VDEICTSGIQATASCCRDRMGQRADAIVNTKRRPSSKRGGAVVRRSQRLARSRVSRRSLKGSSSTSTCSRHQVTRPGSRKMEPAAARWHGHKCLGNSAPSPTSPDWSGRAYILSSFDLSLGSVHTSPALWLARPLMPVRVPVVVCSTAPCTGYMGHPFRKSALLRR